MARTVYKICPRELWREAEQNGRFAGAPVDLADGFIHFSTAAQARETASKHFAGQAGLLLIGVGLVVFARSRNRGRAHT